MSVIAVVLFHRDLRLVDHGALTAAAAWAEAQGATVLPLFVFTPAQVGRGNPYKSKPAIQFMIDSLEDLEVSLKSRGSRLYVAYADTVAVLKSLGARLGAVFETRDYTPFAKQREAAIRAVCEERGAVFEAVEDLYLTAPGSVITGGGKTYQKFTPFWEAAKKLTVPKPTGVPNRVPWFSGRLVGLEGATTLAKMRQEYVGKHRLAGVQRGGRTEGLKNLASVAKDYHEAHDYLDAHTAQLSAHNHFGTLSIREVYWEVPIGGEALAAFRRQLYWRDFYGHIMADFKGLYGVDPWEFQAPSGWRSDKEREVFEAWSRGATGVELVDAAMRQLLATGFMHNRARLVAASWLVKDMGVQWRWGERFFAQHLVDYDPAQNMMNWIWVASVLPFASAPFRRHDPERTAAKLDPTGTYRRRWLSNH
jgi:deoxyribodipyrimidine photo-lyase